MPSRLAVHHSMLLSKTVLHQILSLHSWKLVKKSVACSQTMFTDFFHFDDNCSIQSECWQVGFRAQVYTSYNLCLCFNFVGVVSLYSEYYSRSLAIILIHRSIKMTTDSVEKNLLVHRSWYIILEFFPIILLYYSHFLYLIFFSMHLLFLIRLTECYKYVYTKWQYAIEHLIKIITLYCSLLIEFL